MAAPQTKARLSAQIAVACFAFFANTHAALAWGASGHRFISELGVKSLPAELPAFLRDPEAVRMIGEIARDPDRSKSGGPPLDPDTNPAHHIFLSDDLKVLGGPPLTPLPATREAYDTVLRAFNQTEYRAGYLPYAILDGWQQLAVDFAYWRADVAAARFAKDEVSRQWFDKDRALRERLTLRDLGYWSHFVADGSQPLHVTVHANGWGNFPNPENFTTAYTIHALFEGAFVRSYVREADITKVMTPYRDCGCTMPERVAAYLTATHENVIPLYRLDNKQAFDSGTAEGKTFVTARLAAGASELRDLIVEAWKASEDNSVGFPLLKVRDIEAGTVNPLGNLQGLD